MLCCACEAQRVETGVEEMMNVVMDEGQMRSSSLRHLIWPAGTSGGIRISNGCDV